MFDIITFGSAAQDIVLKPKHLTMLKYGKETAGKEVCFPMGSKIDVEDIIFTSGGGGTNTAATFALQGFKTAFCGVIGKDVSGQEIINELKKLKIDTSLVQKTDKKRTNHSVVILNGAQDRTILAYRGAADMMAKKDIPFTKLKTKWIYLAPLSGLLCLPAGQQATTPFEEIVNWAFDKNIKIAVNPGIAQLSMPKETLERIFSKINVVFLNQEEASFLTKIPFEQELEIFKQLDLMCKGVVVMTKGGEGVIVSDGKYRYSAVPPKDRNIVDTTGAGDAFASGFLSEFMKSADIEKSIQLGMGNSVGNLSAVGAKTGLLKKGQKFEKVEVKKEKV